MTEAKGSQKGTPPERAGDPDEGLLALVGAALERFGPEIRIRQFEASTAPGFQCDLAFPKPEAGG